MSRLIVAITICLCLVSGCSKLEDPDAINNDAKIQVTTSRATLLSNASDTTLVIARVPADAGVVDVTFSTTNGKFIQSADKSVKQQTDSLSANYRYARVILRSDTSKGTVYITAESGTARNRTTITFN